MRHNFPPLWLARIRNFKWLLGCRARKYTALIGVKTGLKTLQKMSALSSNKENVHPMTSNYTAWKM